MKEWNIPLLLELLNACAKIGLDSWGQAKVSFKSDNSLVTPADKEIENYLNQHLNQEDQGVYMLGEETLSKRTERYIQQALSQTTWIVDPIDGTSPYAFGLPHWGISIGYAQQGQLQHGAVYLVPLGELFISHEEEILYAKVNVGEEISSTDLKTFKAKTAPLSSTSILSFSRVWNKEDIRAIENPIHSTGSSIFALTKLMQGCYLAVVTKFCLWDGAACFPLLKRANYLCAFTSGRYLDLGINEGNYHISEKSPYRWTLKEPIIISANQKSLDYTRRLCHKTHLLSLGC